MAALGGDVEARCAVMITSAQVCWRSGFLPQMPLSKVHVEYDLTVLLHFPASGTKSWQLMRHRYSDFDRLHKVLEAVGIAVPLPPKQHFGNLDEGFLLKRRFGLQRFLDQVLEEVGPLLTTSLQHSDMPLGGGALALAEFLGLSTPSEFAAFGGIHPPPVPAAQRDDGWVHKHVLEGDANVQAVLALLHKQKKRPVNHCDQLGRKEAALLLRLWVALIPGEGMSTISSPHEDAAEHKGEVEDRSALLELHNLDTAPTPRVHHPEDGDDAPLPSPRRVVPSAEWKRLGFQGTDPATDFRSMGGLAVRMLVYYAEQRTESARTALEMSHRTPAWYPFATAGINIAAFIVQLANARALDPLLHAAVAVEAWTAAYATGPGGAAPPAPEVDLLSGTVAAPPVKAVPPRRKRRHPNGRRYSSVFTDTHFSVDEDTEAGLEAIYDLFCDAFEDWAATWAGSGAGSPMDFPRVFQAYRNRWENRYPIPRQDEPKEGWS